MRDHNHMSYNRVGRRWHHSSRGFRLKYPKRFSVQRLRARFMYLFRLLSKWRCSYGHAFQLLKRVIIRSSHVKRRNNSSSSSSSSSRSLVMDQVPNIGRADHCRLRSFGRSNSFYSEAIADCLEFIKRSSISVDQTSVSQR